MSTETTTRAASTLASRAAAGVAGGLAGGVVFGVLMHARDMLPMVAQLIGGESVALGWLVHLFNSALFGAVFGVLVARWAARPLAAGAAGLGYGLLWWVLGALLIMPAWLGMSGMIFHVGENQWWSLLGHLVYGLVLGLVTAALVRRKAGRG